MEIVLDYYEWKPGYFSRKGNFYATGWKNKFLRYQSDDPHLISRGRLIKGALVSGYGLVSAMANNLIANPAEVHEIHGLMRGRYAMLKCAFTLSKNQPVLTTKSAWDYIEQSERSVASFLLGGACSYYGICTWLKTWQTGPSVKGFFHYGLYTNPVLSNLGLIPYTVSKQRPDYLCNAVASNGQSHWFAVEAKARLTKGLEWGIDDVAGAMEQAASVPVLTTIVPLPQVHYPSPVVTYVGMSKKGLLPKVRLSVIDPPADSPPDPPAETSTDEVQHIHVSETLLTLSNLVGAIVTLDAFSDNQTRSSTRVGAYNFSLIDSETYLGLPQFFSTDIDTPLGTRKVSSTIMSVYSDLTKIGTTWLTLSVARDNDLLSEDRVFQYLDEAIRSVGGQDRFLRLLNNIRSIQEVPPLETYSDAATSAFFDNLMTEDQVTISPSDFLVAWLGWTGVEAMLNYIDKQITTSARVTRLSLAEEIDHIGDPSDQPIEDIVACCGLWILERNSPPARTEG